MRVFATLVALALLAGCAQFNAMADKAMGYDSSKRLAAEQNYQERKAAKAAQADLFIDRLWTMPPNSVGGVDVRTQYATYGQKSIKYLRLETELFNRVGDRVVSEIGNEGRKVLKITGLISADDGLKYGSWSAVWYNNSGHCAALVAVHVEYMDGTKNYYAGEDLSSVVASRVNTGTCPPDAVS